MQYQNRTLDNEKLVQMGTQGVDITLEKGKKIVIVEGCVESNFTLVYLNGNQYDVLIKTPGEVLIGHRVKLASKQLIKRIEDQTQAANAPQEPEHYERPSSGYGRGYQDRGYGNNAMRGAFDRAGGNFRR